MPDEDVQTGPAPEDAAQDPGQDGARMAADRLERALERIAAAAHSARPAGADQSGGAPASAEIARRLDAVIAALRSALRTA